MSAATKNPGTPGEAAFVPGFGVPEPTQAGRAADPVARSPVDRGSTLSLVVGAGVLVTAVLAVLAWSITQWSVATFLAGTAFGVGWDF